MNTDSNTTGESPEILPFKIRFSGRSGWNGCLIHDRDRAWLSFLPVGTTAPKGHMFEAVTKLDMSDPDVVSKVEIRVKKKGKDINLADYDVYSIYRTTCG